MSDMNKPRARHGVGCAYKMRPCSCELGDLRADIAQARDAALRDAEMALREPLSTYYNIAAQPAFPRALNAIRALRRKE